MVNFLKMDPRDLTKSILLGQEGFSARLAGKDNTQFLECGASIEARQDIGPRKYGKIV